jgi:hypothetical protein
MPEGGVTIPVSWVLGIAGTILAAVGSASWYMSQEAAELRALRTSIARIEAEDDATRKARDDLLAAIRLSLGTLDTRTTRIESQLIFLTDQQQARGRK